MICIWNIKIGKQRLRQYRIASPHGTLHCLLLHWPHPLPPRCAVIWSYLELYINT